MSLSVDCPECKTKLRLASPTVGAAKVKCRRCGASFYVNALPGADAPITPPPAPPPAAVEFIPLTRATAAAMAGPRRRERPAEEPLSKVQPRDRAIGAALLAGLVLALGGMELFLLRGGPAMSASPDIVAAPEAGPDGPTPSP